MLVNDENDRAACHMGIPNFEKGWSYGLFSIIETM